MGSISLRERAENLDINYLDLRGFTYIAGLIVDDMVGGDKEYTEDICAAVMSISSFMCQKVTDLQGDIKHLVAHVLSGD